MMYDKDQWKKYEGIVMAIDPAGRGADETGYAVVAQLHGKLFILAIGGLSGGYDDATLKLLAYVAKTNKVRHIIIEANFGDGMYTKLFNPVLHRIHPCVVEEVKHSIQKEKRIIDTLEPVLNQHRLIINKSEVVRDINFLMENPERNQRYSFCYQLTRITRQRGALKQDDRLDALCIAVDYYTESMDRDERKADADHKLHLLQEEVKKHREHVMGKPVRNTQGFLGKRFGR
jgi:Holliday junction resolvasome RuvABC endonuclease subunit